MALDIVAAGAGLQEIYIGQEVVNLAYEDRAGLAMLPKMENFRGSNYPLPNMYAPPASGSASFPIAYNGAATGPSLGRFSLTRRNYYQVGFISGEAMEAGDGDIGSFIQMAKLELDSSYQAVANRAAWQVYRSGTGTQGQIGLGSGSTTAGGTLLATGQWQLTNVSDGYLIEVGQALQWNATDGGPTPVAAIGYVVSIDRDQAIFGVSNVPNGALTALSGWAVGGYIVNNGDNGQVLQGMLGWIPPTAPVAGDNWFGLDRSKDPTRLAGVRYNGLGQSIRDALIAGAGKVIDNGGSPKTTLVHTNAWTALSTSLEGQVVFTTKEAFKAPQVSFPAITLQTSKGACDVMGDLWCPANYAFMLTMSSWELASIGKVPKLLDYNDPVSNFLRVTGQDAAEVRFGFRGNVACLAPGRNGLLAISY